MSIVHAIDRVREAEERSQEDITRIYGEYARPTLVEMFKALRIDVTFHRAQGDRLFYRVPPGHVGVEGEEREVLDMVGGFGTTLLGHNHPVLVARAVETLRAGRPQNSQGSVHAAAAQLAERLSEIARAETGKSFVVNFANSGTEAVELAIKHAALELSDRLDEVISASRARHIQLRRQVAQNPKLIRRDAVQHLAAEVGQGQIERLNELVAYLDEANRDAARTPPVFICLERAFHGKTTGALKLTYNKDYRLPNANLGLRSVFVDPEDPAQIDRELARDRKVFGSLAIGENGSLKLLEEVLHLVAGFFVEPIQGEGGIHIVGADLLRHMGARANELGIPVIVDEIQCGMGRTGSFFAATGSGFTGDYYTLSKALGGGLAKVAACLIDKARYRERFSVMHTSTFAEDDGGCEVARAALDLLTADGGRLVKQAGEKGALLRAKLEALRERYSDVIREVRGRGLMIGVEFREIQPQGNSAALWHIDLTEHLGHFLCGHFLNAEGIRILPTLSSPRTLRLEPSVFITEADMDRVVAAFERACKAIRGAHFKALAAYQIGARDVRDDYPSYADQIRDRLVEAPNPHAIRVGFLGHFIDPAHLGWWDPSLKELTVAERSELLDRMSTIGEPAVLEQVNVTSDTGDVVHFNFIGLPIGPMQIARDLMETGGRRFRELVLQGVEVAKVAGCRVLGFGGYTSIATRNCTEIVDEAIAVTTGNSLTVAMGLQALREMAKEKGVDLPTAHFAALGATGNICSTYAIMLAPQVASVTLIGRNKDDPRLRRVASEIAAAVHQEITRPSRRKKERGGAASQRRVGHLHANVAASQAFKRFADRAPGPDVGAALFDALTEELGDACPIRISGEVAALREANLIVCASNSLTTLVGPEHLARDRTVVVCDISTPADVSDEAAKLPNVTVILGGVVKVPGRSDFHVRGLPLMRGEAYACMSETMLMGLTGMTENFSVGHIYPHQVRKIAQIASIHGYTLSQAKWGRSF